MLLCVRVRVCACVHACMCVVCVCVLVLQYSIAKIEFFVCVLQRLLAFLGPVCYVTYSHHRL